VADRPRNRLYGFIDLVLQQLQGPKYESKLRGLSVEHIVHGAVVTFQRGNLILGWNQPECAPTKSNKNALGNR